MESILLSVNVMLPLFILLTLGFFLTKIKLVNPEFLKTANKLNFNVFLPALVFVNIYQNSASQFNLKQIFFAVSSIILVAILLIIIVPIFEKKNQNRGALIQGILRSNYLIFGMPVSIAILGKEGASNVATMTAFVIPLYVLICVSVLSYFKKDQINLKGLLLDICKNPLLIGAIVGWIAILTKIKLPAVILGTIVDISRVATPLALIVLGASFQFNWAKDYRKQLIWGVLSKLIIVPLVFIPVAVLLNFKGAELVSLMLLFASPTAVASHALAQGLGANDDLAGGIVIFSSAFSIITMFIWIFILSYMNLF